MKNFKEYIEDHAVHILAFTVAVIALLRLALATSLLATIFKML